MKIIDKLKDHNEKAKEISRQEVEKYKKKPTHFSRNAGKYAIAGILGTAALSRLALKKYSQPEGEKYDPSKKTVLDPNYSPIKELQKSRDLEKKEEQITKRLTDDINTTKKIVDGFGSTKDITNDNPSSHLSLLDLDKVKSNSLMDFRR